MSSHVSDLLQAMGLKWQCGSSLLGLPVPWWKSKAEYISSLISKVYCSDAKALVRRKDVQMEI